MLLSVCGQLAVATAEVHAAPPVLLWGVDSCSPYADSWFRGPGSHAVVSWALGRPDFWGRYLTDSVCPPLSVKEIQLAHALHMGILPIFNSSDCSNVQGRDRATGYALGAVTRAVEDGIPAGTAIAMDIEPVGSVCPGAARVDKAFIEGWYDVIRWAGYAPMFYGNTIPNSAFANAWCAAVLERPEIAGDSYLWSFEPSKVHISHAARYAPAFNPDDPGCPSRLAVWQYSLSSGSTPDVDVDLAGSDFPFWRP
ncbi:MAG TPA: glycoside hydrolase domain-containing protein [Candidatus Dormibacteraeota bacterium]|nr:glycoside hydrolase domain-containing protein [Candidatus Dormibacteraeota bacterium]